jgi:hypothetical protein
MNQNKTPFLANSFIQSDTNFSSNTNNKPKHKKDKIYKVKLSHIPPQMTKDYLLNLIIPPDIPKPDIELWRKTNSATLAVNLVFKKKKDAKLAVARINLIKIQGVQLKAKLVNNYHNHWKNQKKLQVTSLQVLEYIKNVLMPQKPSNLNNVEFKFKKDTMTLVLKGQNSKSAAKWISKQMEECDHVIIQTDANTEQKINAFKTATMDKCCAYGTVDNIFGVEAHFVVHKTNYAVLRKYLTLCLSLEDSIIAVKRPEIKAVKKKKHKSGTCSNLSFPNKGKENGNFGNLIQTSHSNIFFK